MTYPAIHNSVKRNITVLVLMMVSYSSFSQETFSLSGIVTDSTNSEPLVGVTIVLSAARDSSRWQGTVTDSDGKFKIVNITPGPYRLKATYIGYILKQQRIFIRNTDIDLEPIKLSQSFTTLKDVEVTGLLIRVEQKGDTTQFNANAYKTNRDASAEDLITKMPGITSDATGIKAQGENVQQVLVDGKPFFGEDPSVTLKNLPAEVIDKIEVFDRLSEQSQFTGFDDGQTRKTINIVTKKGITKGGFGKLYAGAGENGRYIGGANINSFKGERKFSVIGLTNNINQQNFSNDDLLGVAGTEGGSSGGRGRGGRNQSSGSSFLVGQQSGISTTHALGINYSNDFGKKIEFSGSYFFNQSDNDRRTALQRNFITSNPRDSGLFYAERNIATTRNINHRMNFRMVYNIDSANSIVITPTLSQQQNRSQSLLTGISSKAETQERQLDNTNYAYNEGYTLTNNILFRHRFAKRGRTLSMGVNININDRDRDTDIQSLNQDFINDTTINVSQQSDQITAGNTYSSTLAFTEPLTKTSQLQFNYTISRNNNATDKQTYDRNDETGEHINFNTLLSNVFKNTYTNSRGGVSYRINQKKYNVMTGLNFLHANLANTQEFPVAFQLDRNFKTLLPQTTFNYRFSKDENLRVIYRTETNPPSISQLQNVINNPNTLFLRTGNPELKQNWQQTLSLRYGKTNATKGTSLMLLLHGSYVKNYIGNATINGIERDTVVNGIPLHPGEQLSYPINVRENWNARTFLTLGLPINALKSNLNLNTGFNYNRTPAFINQTTNLAHNYSFSEGIVLGSNHEKIDFTLSYTANYVIVQNTILAGSDNNYFNHNSSLRITWQPWKGLVFNSNLVNTMYTGLGDGFNQSIWYWNASIGYKLLKDQLLDIRLTASDLLNQNQSINREVTETYIEDTQINALTRYFMLMITYNLRKFK
jgi:hypothetical protein